MSEGRLSCGFVIARDTESGCKTLLLRAYHHWDFPKGICEQDETPLNAALREVREETGIEDLQLEWDERFFETGPYSKGKVARYYLGRTTTKQVVMGLSPETGQPEHHEWRWVTFDEAYDLGSPRVKQIVQWARQNIGV